MLRDGRDSAASTNSTKSYNVYSFAIAQLVQGTRLLLRFIRLHEPVRSHVVLEAPIEQHHTQHGKPRLRFVQHCFQMRSPRLPAHRNCIGTRYLPHARNRAINSLCTSLHAARCTLHTSQSPATSPRAAKRTHRLLPPLSKAHCNFAFP